MEQKNEAMKALEAILFSNKEFSNVRGVVINDEPWLVGKDVCVALGDKNHNRTLKRLDDEDRQTYQIRDSLGRKQNVTVINESGLYSVIFAMQPEKSNKHGVSDAYPIEVQERIEKIHRFKHWVTAEVLPQIRKTGGYIPVKQEDDEVTIMSKALNIMRNTLDKKDELIAMQNQTIKEQEPLVSFANTVSATPTMVDMKTMAKLLNQENEGLNFGRNKLFAWLRQHNYLMKDNTPYQRYVKQGIFKVTEEEIDTMNGKKMCTKTYVTGKGQLYLDKKIKEYYKNLEETA